jgi:hypothetical protein
MKPNHLKSLMISYILPIIAVVSVAFTNQKANDANQLCKHQYALCTSALCVPMPGDPTKAICFCDVKEGASMSTVPCDTITPSTDADGIRTVYSTFSLDQFREGKKSMKCPSNTPWTWCLNKRCTVDPSNAKKAVCTCDVKRNVGEWTTLGGNCDTSTCKTGYWSGAPLSDFADGTAFLLNAFGLDKSPVKWCQAD